MKLITSCASARSYCLLTHLLMHTRKDFEHLLCTDNSSTLQQHFKLLIREIFRTAFLQHIWGSVPELIILQNNSGWTLKYLEVKRQVIKRDKKNKTDLLSMSMTLHLLSLLLTSSKFSILI